MSFEEVQRTVAQLRAALASARPLEREPIARDLAQNLEAAITFRRNRLARIETQRNLAVFARGAGAGDVDGALLAEQRELMRELAELQGLQQEVARDIQAAADRAREDARPAAARADVGPGAAAARAVPLQVILGVRRRQEEADDGVARGAARARLMTPVDAERDASSTERMMQALVLMAQRRPEGEKLLGVSSDLAASIRSAGLPPLPTRRRRGQPSMQDRLLRATELEAMVRGSLLTAADLERVFEERFFRPRVNMTSSNNAALRHCAKNGFVRCVRLLLDNPDVDPSANTFEAVRLAENAPVLRLLLADPRTADWRATNETIERIASLLDYIESRGAHDTLYVKGSLLEPYIRYGVEFGDKELAPEEDAALRALEDDAIRDVFAMYRLYETRSAPPIRPFPESLVLLAANRGLVRTLRMLLLEYGGSVDLVLARPSLGSFATFQMLVELYGLEDWVPNDDQMFAVISRFDEDEDEDEDVEDDHWLLIQDFLRRRGEAAVSASMLDRAYRRIPYRLVGFALSQPAFDVNARFDDEDRPTLFASRLADEDYVAAQAIAADARFVWSQEDLDAVFELLPFVRNNLDMDDLLLRTVERLIQNASARPLLLATLQSMLLSWFDSDDANQGIILRVLLTGTYKNEDEADDDDVPDIELANRLVLTPDDGVFDAVLVYLRALVQNYAEEVRSGRDTASMKNASFRVFQFWLWAGFSDEDIDTILLSERENFFYLQNLFEGVWNR
jgi:hypothetical protein